MSHQHRPVDVVVAIHGILTGRSNPTWPERLEQYLTTHRPDTVVLTDQYEAGPFPRLNWFLGNPKRGRATTALVRDWIATGTVRSLSFVAHSNGCDIARRAILELAETAGPGVAAAIFISPPLPASMEGMDLEAEIATGHLKRLLVYAASEDSVLAPPVNWKRPWTLLGNIARWPYGNAGRIGLPEHEMLAGFEGRPTGRVATRMFRGWGHGDFFPRSNYLRNRDVFAQIETDLFTP